MRTLVLCLFVLAACFHPDTQPPEPPTYPPMRPADSPYAEPPMNEPPSPPSQPPRSPTTAPPPPQPRDPEGATPPGAGPLEPEGVPPQRFPPPPGAPPDAWSLSDEELRRMDGYRAFSADGLLFAYVEPVGEARQPMLFLLAAPTDTVESAVPLTSREARRQAAIDLSEEGFPRPGVKRPVPEPLDVRIEDDLVQLTFAGRPAARPFRPFAAVPDVEPVDAEVVAVSPDGLLVAVRVAGRAPDIEAPFEYRIVRLFE